MKSKNKICLLYPYYGSWPWYFNFFLKSCKYNPDITFQIITDITPPNSHPENVKFLHKTLKDIEALISKKLSLKINLKHPYKLCDFRPAFGVIFDEILIDFDFWGHGDIDVIFGNIKEFFDNKFLYEYDIVSVRPEYPSGFFTLYKNNSLANSLFRRSKDYEYIFTSPKHFCFDECNFEHQALMDGIDIFKTNSSIESMMHVIKKAENENLIKCYFDFHAVEGIPGGISWKNGTITYNNKIEFLLYHLIQVKCNSYFVFPKWENIPNIFYIGKSSFSRYSPKSFFGIISRFFNSIVPHLKKSTLKLVLWFNKVLHKIHSSRSIINTENEGSYILGNQTLTLESNGGYYYAVVGFPMETKIKLEPIFYDKSLFFCYEWNWLFKLKNGTIEVRSWSGQEIVYKKK